MAHDALLLEKERRLREFFSRLSSVIIAFSGGVDSSLVAKVAYDVLKDRAIAVTAKSPSVPKRELEDAKRVAEAIGIDHSFVETNEITDENYVSNTRRRCYFCKNALYSTLRLFGDTHGYETLCNGTIVDDLGDYRPGLVSATEHDVVSPLSACGFTKEDVRLLAKKYSLPVWHKPASPCLSSRIPYGSRVTVKKLGMVESAENFLRDTLGVRVVRVRHFGECARVELKRDDFEIYRTHEASIIRAFENIGFRSLELAEFRSGSLNKDIRIRVGGN